jgi:hypothetical protein
MPTILPARKKMTPNAEWDASAIAIGTFMTLVLFFSILSVHGNLTIPASEQSPEDLIVDWSAAAM